MLRVAPRAERDLRRREPAPSARSQAIARSPLGGESSRKGPARRPRRARRGSGVHRPSGGGVSAIGRTFSSGAAEWQSAQRTGSFASSGFVGSIGASTGPSIFDCGVGARRALEDLAVGDRSHDPLGEDRAAPRGGVRVAAFVRIATGAERRSFAHLLAHRRGGVHRGIAARRRRRQRRRGRRSRRTTAGPETNRAAGRACRGCAGRTAARAAAAPDRRRAGRTSRSRPVPARPASATQPFQPRAPTRLLNPTSSRAPARRRHDPGDADRVRRSRASPGGRARCPA